MPDQLAQRIALKGVIFNDCGNVLLLREARTYGDGTNQGRYGLPGGRLNPGEAYLDGLNREIHEETGLTVQSHEPVFVGEWRPVIHGIPHQIVAIFFRCELSGTTQVRLSEEHDDFVWVEPAELNKYTIMTPDAEAIMAAVERNR